MGSYIKGIIVAVILLFLATFGAKNSQPVEINLPLLSQLPPIPVFYLVYISLILGFFGGIFFGVSQRLGQMRTLKALKKENKELKAKVPQEQIVEAVKPGEKSEAEEPKKKNDQGTAVAAAEKTASK